MQDILQTTMEIKKISPNIYKYLDETPLRFEENKLQQIKDYIQYLHTLKEQLKTQRSRIIDTSN
jgi:hypothetical protein